MIRIAWVLALATALGCDEPDSTLTVFAASSLTEAMTDIARSFEAEQPSTDVAASFAGSQVLRVQIEHGAPADVFASADAAHVDALLEAGLVSERHVFATNELVVIVPASTASPITGFEQLPVAERIVLGDEAVPAGRYARRVLSAAADRYGAEFSSAVREHVVSEESNVRLVRAKVELGEADAAIVYRTDAVASDRVRIVEIPEELNVRADYHVAVVTASARPAVAQRFVSHLLGADARRRLAERGFGAPAP